MPGSGVADLATAAELRGRLRLVAFVLALGTGAFLVRDVVVNAGQVSLASLVFVVVPAVVAAALFRGAELSLQRLRLLELAVIFAAAAFLAIEDSSWLVGAMSSGDAGRALARWHMTATHFALLILLYGAFIPASGRRAALVVVPLAAVPVALGWFLRVRHPDSAHVLDAAGPIEGFVGVAFFLAASVVVAVLAASLTQTRRAAQLQSAVLGMYDLVERIGAGGMGEVWLARHHMLARPAAIKLIRPELLGEENPEAKERAIRRFEREAQVTASLRSPHTIVLYDFGTSQTGVFFYVMEHLDGLDLATLVKRFGPVSIERAVHYLIQACDALSDAHDSNLIHRDIKPANIFACRMGTKHDYVKVLDFGLVKTSADEVASTELTLEGTTTGTPAYMAPEMATGAGKADARSDIYALGCVAYYLVTGQPPFDAENPVALLVEHINTPATPPSKRTEVPVPEELDRIILRCLEKDPANRFQTTEELATALSECPLPVEWSRSRAEDWWSKHLPENQGAA